MATWLSTISNLVASISGLGKEPGPEGVFRNGPYYTSGGIIPDGAPLNFWQLGWRRGGVSPRSAMVEACQSAYAQTVAMLPASHYRADYLPSGKPTGGRTRVANAASAPTRALRRPNDYQTGSDLLLNIVRQMKGKGAAYVLAVRNGRDEVEGLHLFDADQSKPLIGEDGSIYYELSGNEIVERRWEAATGGRPLRVPARDVAHIRLHTPRHPLYGETPLMAAALDVATSDVILQRQLAFFANRSRPSYVLGTDEKLKRDQVKDLRELWEEHSSGLNEGKTPILSWGVKPFSIGASAKDSELAETLRMSEENIALAYRVPLQLFGKGSGQIGSTESLMQMWLASGLGFLVNHIEVAFDVLFELKGFPEEYVELDTRVLLRSNFRERIAGLKDAVIGGIMSPDEARNAEDLPVVPGGYGAEPRVQQQVVPLSHWQKERERLETLAQQPPPANDNPDPDPAPDDEADEEDQDEGGDQEGGSNGERQSTEAIGLRLIAASERLYRGA